MLRVLDHGPGSLRVVMFSPPSRCSMTSIVESRPLASWNAARVMPSISTRKLKLPYGSLRACHGRASLSGLRSTSRAALPDADADDDELGRIARAHADLDVQAAERAARRTG